MLQFLHHIDLQHIHESLPALCRTSVRQGETVGGGGWCSPPPVIVITTVKFKSLVKLWLIFFSSSHNATLSQTGLHVAQHASTTAPLIRCLTFQRAASDESSAMAGKLTERSIKWQLCYDMTARTWWMVSGALLSSSP